MLSYQAFIKQINGGEFAPAYLLFGEEKYLQEELVDRISAAFLGQDSDFGREKIEGSALSLEEVLERAGEEGLFADRRLLIVDNPPYLAAPKKNEDTDRNGEDKPADGPEKGGLEMLENYLARAASGSRDSIIIFLADRVDRRRRPFKLLDKKGSAVECNPLKGETLAIWIRNKASALGRTIEKQALERLLMAGDQNLHYLSAELEKYSAYLRESENVITLSTVEALFSGDIQGDVFKLSDAMAEGNMPDAHDFLDLLLRRREKPLLIFFMLVRHYRLLLHACCLMKDGLPQNEFAAALEVHPFVARKLREQAVSYSISALEEVILALQNADQQIKTGQIEPSQALKLTLSRIDYIQTAARGGV